jgi:hypothetical protein
MSKRDRGRTMVGPWRSMHTAVWLIGIAILFWKGWWWPGILVLVAISMILEALLSQMAPQAFEPEEPAGTPQAMPQALPGPVPATPPAPATEHRLELLPAACPNCSGPIRGHEVRWTGPQSTDCPYCGTNLPMKKDAG